MWTFLYNILEPIDTISGPCAIPVKCEYTLRPLAQARCEPLITAGLHWRVRVDSMNGHFSDLYQGSVWWVLRLLFSVTENLSDASKCKCNRKAFQLKANRPLANRSMLPSTTWTCSNLFTWETPPSPVNRHTDKHDWKHYLTYTGGNNFIFFAEMSTPYKLVLTPLLLTWT